MMVSRKRGRAGEEDCDDSESMPISKRINRLHIRQGSTEQVEEELIDPAIHVNNNVVFGQNHCCPSSPNSQNNVPSQQPWQIFTEGGRISANGHIIPFSQPAVPNTSTAAVDQMAPSCSTSQNQVAAGYAESSYDPDLDASQNPYYFHINRVLFLANTDRQQRRKTMQNNGC